MSIVIYTNSKNGCRYAYESTYEWSPEHKQSRPKRKYLGRVDDEGNIIYSSHQKGGARQMSPKTREKKAAQKAGVDPPDETAEKIRKLYEEPEKDRQECMKRIHSLEAEISELRRSNQRLKEILASVHSMTSVIG